jgi:pentatricopeptide repeat protein
MYAKCGSIEDAWRVFKEMPSQNVVTWNAMVLGHVKCGQGQKALELFQQMQ